MPTIAPIPTTYRGYRFRSRLEARWAVFFDALELPFEYELQGYSTPAGWYLPDFWLPTLHIHAEVKPEDPPRTALVKIADVAHGTRRAFVVLIGSPAYQTYLVIEPAGTSRRIHSTHFAQGGPLASESGAAIQRATHLAIDAARGARFA